MAACGHGGQWGWSWRSPSFRRPRRLAAQRHPSADAMVGGDHKTGFCLSDGFHFDTSTGPAGGHYGNYSPSDYCQSGNQNALSVVMGISPGWQDDYSPAKEGQYVDVTNVPA